MIRQSLGFTLVEMLVVISIIAVLSIIGVTVFTNATSLARDAQRMKDLEAIKQALELYRGDVHNYPPTLSFGASLPGYMEKIPNDLKVGQTYFYQPLPVGCTTTCASFILCAKKEGAEDTYDLADCNPYNCGTGSGSCNIGVSSQ